MTLIKLLDRELPVKIEWLRSFLAVVDSGGFTKASRELRRSQPAVSTHVKELEANLDARLFELVGGRTHLTPSGKIAAVQGVVTLGASTTPGNYLLPALLGRFERTHPRVRTMLLIGNSVQMLDRLTANEVDIGVIGIEPDARDFISGPFRRDEIVLFASRKHRLARRRRVAAADLSAERFLLRDSDSATRRLSDRWMEQHGLRPPVMHLGCPESIKRAVAAGLGLGFLSRFAIEWELKQRKVVVLRASGLPIRRQLYVVHHRGKHPSPAMRHLLAALDSENP
ncbi:MAG: LysR family transcriptional regulator [Planctomycetes bacterium]|nr:LysR family transcriptional regulator [Planctomycetota bacterium]